MYVKLIVLNVCGPVDMIKEVKHVPLMEAEALLYAVGVKVTAEGLESFLTRSPDNSLSAKDGDTRYVFRAA